MKILMKLLLSVSSLVLAAAYFSCAEEDVDPRYIHHCVVINSTDNDIRFSSDSSQFSIEICCGDTISYEDSKEDVFLNIILYSMSPKVQVGNDSVITLTQFYSACWVGNCHNTKIGPYEWIHTYVIDDQWLKDAWTESMTGECPPGAKHNWYD